MNKCACPPCNRTVASSMRMKLTKLQASMIGYFCPRCILSQCGATHRDNRK